MSFSERRATHKTSSAAHGLKAVAPADFSCYESGINGPETMIASSLTPSDLDVLSQLLVSPSGAGFPRRWSGDAADGDAWDQSIASLRSHGCVIDTTPAARHRLVRSGLSVWREYLEHETRAASYPRRVAVYQTVGSTQDAVRRMGSPDAVAIADEQTAGRGRLGRAWVAPPGSAILMSVAHTTRHGDSHDHLQCVAAVAVAQALERLTKRQAIPIKWPNDLLIEGKKLAGILVETHDSPHGRIAIIGIGVNVALTREQLAAAPDDVRQRIVTLRELGCEYDRLYVAGEVLMNLDRLLAASDRALWLDEWRTRNLMRSQRATFGCDGGTITGEVIDLDADAGLIVRGDDGVIVHLHAATTTVIERHA